MFYKLIRNQMDILRRSNDENPWSPAAYAFITVLLSLVAGAGLVWIGLPGNIWIKLIPLHLIGFVAFFWFYASLDYLVGRRRPNSTLENSLAVGQRVWIRPDRVTTTEFFFPGESGIVNVVNSGRDSVLVDFNRSVGIRSYWVPRRDIELSPDPALVYRARKRRGQ